MTLPRTMTIIEAAQPGGPEVLRPAQAPVPVPKPDEVLVRVRAAGVNRPDIQQRRAPIRRRPAPARSSAWKSRVRSSPLGAEAAGWRAGERSARCERRRLRRVLRRAGEPMPALARRLRRGARRGPAGDVLHRLGQRVRARPRCARARPRWCMAAAAASASPRSSSRTRSAPRCSRPPARRRSARPACGSAPTAAINYRDAGFRRRGQGTHRRPRRRCRFSTWWAATISARNLRCLAMDGRLVLIAFLRGSKVEALDLTAIMRAAHRHRLDDAPAHTAQKAAIAAALRAKVWPLLDAGNARR